LHAKRAVAAWLAAVPFIFWQAASAGEVTVEQWRGHAVVKLTGVIDAGTADKFAQAADKVNPLPYGLPVLLLDSPGGNVIEALKISQLMDQHPFHTVVPDGAKCASACASIVFIAGKNRTMEENGLLGQHSCALNGVPQPSCNDALSQHAVEHGVSYGAVAAFVTNVAPDKILWLSRQDAEGWGLTKYPGEEWSGFERSEPRVIKMLSGKDPPAQASWRINFRGNGYEAFLRPASDVEREEQLDVFCDERLKGHLFLGMEINGPADKIKSLIQDVLIRTDLSSWNVQEPVVVQENAGITDVITDIPAAEIKPFLSKAQTIEFMVSLPKPYLPMIAKTSLAKSRKVLLFAANHCIQGG
jgi:hypothetical protein